MSNLLYNNLIAPEIVNDLLGEKFEKDEKSYRARMFCTEVRSLAEKYNLPFFVVTDGASATHNDSCPAVINARKAHEQWEIENQINPFYDWDLE